MDKSALSTLNNSTTVLGSGETFTGDWEHNYYSDVGVSCYSDTAGTLYFDFSPDGVNNNSFPPAGFSVSAGIHEFHTAVKLGRRFRVRFINGSSAQSTFRLYTYYGQFRQGNAPLNLAVSKDSDAIVTQAVGSNLQMARGLFTGFITGNKFGRNDDVDAAEDIWRGGGDYTGHPVNPTAETVEVFSASANDGAGTSTGLLTCQIYGLDANYALQDETITLNGTSAVTSANTYVRVFRVKGLTAGSTGSNEGIITVRHTTTTANIFAQVAVGRNQTEVACFTCPAGYIMYVSRIRIAGARSNGSIIADASFQVREFGGVWRPIRLFTIGNNIRADVAYDYPISISAKADVKLRIESVSATNGDFHGEFEYLLVED